jgi:hypothetical protein
VLIVYLRKNVDQTRPGKENFYSGLVGKVPILKF